MPPYTAMEVLFAKESIIMGSIMIHLGKLFNDFDRKCNSGFACMASWLQLMLMSQTFAGFSMTRQWRNFSTLV